MYRDEREALQARLHTVEAELEAERRSREAAEARQAAAQAALDEVRLAARDGGRLQRSRAWPWVVVLAVTCAGLAISGLVLLAQRADQIADQENEIAGTRAALMKAMREGAASAQKADAAQLEARATQGRLADAQRELTRAKRAMETASGLGRLIVDTVPTARVFVDGVDTGRDTPIPSSAPLVLKGGSHKLTFVAGMDRFQYTVSIAPGATVQLAKRLPIALKAPRRPFGSTGQRSSRDPAR
jgi:hypothetical protein